MIRKPMKYLKQFIELESASGIILIFMLAAALFIANSPYAKAYANFVDLPMHISIGSFSIHKPILLWINDGLMALFFMLLALEIKREILDGELSSLNQTLLPGVAAIAGIIVPILIFWGFNRHDAAAMRGWPIPTATDIAFALGVIALLGKRVPSSVKVFIVALSIIDDIVAISIIAIFYTSRLSYLSLGLATAGFLLLLLLNAMHVKSLAAYMLVGIFIWVCVLKSGVHATLAGIFVGLTIPNKVKHDPEFSPLHTLEHNLHPWVAYAILPIFVFVNGGIPVLNITLQSLLSPLPLGIAAGLVLGKTLGVSLLIFILVQLKWVEPIKYCRWPHVIGIAALTGIGFTMSLFISSLAFTNTPYEDLARQGVLLGSALSCLLAVSIFMFSKAPDEPADEAIL